MMLKSTWLRQVIALIAVILFLNGCTEEEMATGPVNGQGSLKVHLVDNPAAFDAVNIVVVNVEAHLSGFDSTSGWIMLNGKAGVYDLMSLRNGVSAVLADSVLPVGHYTQLRLTIGEGSTVVVDGSEYPLEIPGGMESGLKLNHQFTITAGVLYELTLDFDADRSVVLTGSGDYQLHPVIRVQATAAAGSISGILLPSEANASVYTTTGSDTVWAYPDPATGYFKLVALPEGTYTVTFRPSNPGYEEMSVPDVQVLSGQDTGLGVILIGFSSAPQDIVTEQEWQ